MAAPISLLKPAILIISDTAFQDPKSDKSIPILRETLATQGGNRWDEPDVKTVPDDATSIKEAVLEWVYRRDAPNLIVSSGGTGFAVKDVTPEAIAPLIDRPAPGLVHAMLSASLQITPFASMSRPVAGVCKKTLILTLPGSPKGAQENLQAVLKLLPHACIQAAGEDSRSIHAGGLKRLEKEAGFSGPVAVASSGHSHNHSHDHGHDHGHGHKVPKAHTKPEQRPSRSNDPRLGASHRHRSSPYPMLEVKDAINTILSHADPMSTITVPALSPALIGSVASSDIYAKEAVPAYRASIVDGYALVVPATDSGKKGVKGVFQVASVSHAQASSAPPPLTEGTVARITTGAPLPPNANAVAMVEDTAIQSVTSDGKEEATVEILTDAIKAGENIREPGSDIQLNSLIIPKGTSFTNLGGEIGVLVAAGVQNIEVHSKPRVGILSTGDEVTDITQNEPLQGGQIRDSNRPALISLLRGWNLCSDVVDLGIARDTPPGSLETALRAALGQHQLDVVVTTGGVSMGELDLLKPTIERDLGGSIHFGRVSMKPGKPTTFATVSSKEAASGQRTERLIFGLPGNPASALVTANLFVLPALQRMAGCEYTQGLEGLEVRLLERVKCDRERVEYHRVFLAAGKDGGMVTASSTGMQRSSRVGSMVHANGLLVLPQRQGFLEAGDVCYALMMGPIGGLR